MTMTSDIEKIKATNRVLIVALIIAAFFLGSFSNKIASSGNTNSPKIVANDAAKDAEITPVAAAKKPKAISNKDHVTGSKNAKVTLIEYSDYECPYCKDFQTTIKELLGTYGEKIRLAYRHYPLSFHANAQKEAEAAECVAEIGGNDAFWKFSDTIYERTTSNGTGFALENLAPLAAEFGLDSSKVQQCIDSGKFTETVKNQIKEGATAGVEGTPSMFIVDSKGNSQFFVGAQPIETFKTAIDNILNSK